ncbi:MAG: ATP-binding protein [Solidesulfovibrio sp.]|uniref:ATP-binding protein n=1 Tax=Solidesulfovibrio sp. TaxID=2910990 RepID=UPI0031587C32
MARSKHWVERARRTLASSLVPVAVEYNELDWKVCLSEKAERIAEHLSAFANYPGGGYLVFGLDDSGFPCGIGGQSVEGIVTRLANIGRDALEPRILIDHAMEAVGGAAVLIVYIAESMVKPVHRRGKSLEHAYIRSGGTTRVASRQEIGAMLLNSRTPRWEELRASPLMSMQDVFEKLDIVSLCKLLERPYSGETRETMHWLVDEAMVVAHGDEYGITNLGALAAARNLEEFRDVERKRVRIVKYRGLNKIEAISERVGKEGYAIGFEGLLNTIREIIPHSEIIKAALRAEVSVYPEIALREVVANALIHQDFSLTGTSPMIELFDNRIEVTNPGNLLPTKSLDRLIGTRPESRNEMLASTFRRFGICEERGTGFQKAVAAIELYGLPPVSFRQTENTFAVTIFAPRKFSEMSQHERIEACYQHAVIKYFSSSTLTNTSLRERFKMHEKQRTQISNLIGDAVSAGRIKRKDGSSGNKFAEYVPYWA